MDAPRLAARTHTMLSKLNHHNIYLLSFNTALMKVNYLKGRINVALLTLSMLSAMR